MWYATNRQAGVYMTNPDRQSVLNAIEQCKLIGEAEFLRRHSSGARPRKVYLEYAGERHPLKAIWAAAHQPPVHTRTFKTGAAKAGLKRVLAE